MNVVKQSGVRLNTDFPIGLFPHIPLFLCFLSILPTVVYSAQRSAQELPVVESVSITSCSVEGGEELLLSGTNFLPMSRVLFMERGTGMGACVCVCVCVCSYVSLLVAMRSCLLRYLISSMKEVMIDILIYQMASCSGRRRPMLTGTTVMR